jgi:uncharacterized membrane protein (DUF2068 family)
VALSAFALLTLFLSASVIFNLFNTRENEGNYVPFIVWVNFISSIIYLIASYGLIKFKKWPTLFLVVSSVILAAAFIGLKVHISNGGVYEPKTVNAIMFRIALTIVFAVASYFLIIKQKIIE